MYALFENNTIKPYSSLPKNWRNISGLNLLKDESELKKLGWYKVVIDSPQYDEQTQILSGYNYTYDSENDRIVQTAIIIDKPVLTPEELEQRLQEKRMAMVCTNYQARQALILAGLYNSVELAMSDPNVDLSAKVAWEYAGNFYRISPFISSIAVSLGLTDEQLDSLFEQAMSIGV